MGPDCHQDDGLGGGWGRNAASQPLVSCGIAPDQSTLVINSVLFPVVPSPSFPRKWQPREPGTLSAAEAPHPRGRRRRHKSRHPGCRVAAVRDLLILLRTPEIPGSACGGPRMTGWSSPALIFNKKVVILNLIQDPCLSIGKVARRCRYPAARQRCPADGLYRETTAQAWVLIVVRMTVLGEVGAATPPPNPSPLAELPQTNQPSSS